MTQEHPKESQEEQEGSPIRDTTPNVEMFTEDTMNIEAKIKVDDNEQEN